MKESKFYFKKINFWRLNLIQQISILFVVLFIVNQKGYSQCAPCQLPDWQYVREITINHVSDSNSYSNLQELIIMDTQLPISQGKMNSLGNDIRFVDENCSTPLCYWIESGINTDSTKIWVKIPSINAYSSKTIFMFYGNTGSSASSSFSCTFPNVLTVSSSTTLTGNQNYDWIDIQSGVTVSVGAGQLLSLNARKINVLGNINGDNAGYGPAAGPGAGGNGGGSSGGGGGGYGGAGGSGKCPGGQSGAAFGTNNGFDIDMGSGGGASDCSPALGGGGAVKIEGVDVNIVGSISVNGYSVGGGCSDEAAGAGSGGGVLIIAKDVSGNGSLSARGGNGQNSSNKEAGGGGGGGRIKLFYCNSNNFIGTSDVSRGHTGSGDQCSADDSQDGTYSVNTFLCNSTSVGPESSGVYANAGEDVSYCSGSSSTLGATSIIGNTYSWSPTQGLSSASVSNPIVAINNLGNTNLITEYIVTVTNNGCSLKDTVLVTVFPIPTSSFTAQGPVCVTESSLITYTGNATSNASYIWGFNNGTILSGTGQGPYLVSWSQSGTQTISLSVIQNGCTSTTNQQIVNVNPPDADAGQDVVICSGDTAVIGAPAIVGYSYSWSPTLGLDNPSLSNPSVSIINNSIEPDTLYYVVTTTFTTCTLSDTVEVIIKPAPASMAGTDTTYCSGDSVQIGTINNSSFSYLWSPSLGLTNDTISNPWVVATNYSATGISTNYVITTTYTAYNCSSKDTVTISTFQTPTSSFSIADSACAGVATTISYTGNATTAATYSWDFDGGNAQPGVGPGPQETSWATTGYAHIILNVSENGCQSNSSIDSVFIKVSPVSNAGSDTAFCSGKSAVLGTSPLTNYQYVWSPTSNLNNVTVSNPSITVLNTSDTNLVLNYSVVTTLNGCSTSDTVQITVYPAPSGTFIFSNICAGQTVNFNAQSNQSINNWSWNFGDGTFSSGITTAHQYNLANTYDVTLSLTSAMGCIDSITQPIIVYPNPTAQFTLSDTAGCDEFCATFQDNSLISSGTINSFVWNFGDGSPIEDSPQTNHCYSNSTSVTSLFSISLIVTSANGCIDTLTKNNIIEVFPLPVVSFSVSPQIAEYTNPIVSITNQSAIANNWSWDFGDGNTSAVQNPNYHSYADTGIYNIKLIGYTEHGCVDSSIQTITIEPEFLYFVPNAFTPNEDGTNNFFIGTGVFVVDFEMQIFDRWGNLIFESKDQNTPWDGKIRNTSEFAPQDVYVYAIKIKDIKNKEHQYRGIVTLIK